MPGLKKYLLALLATAGQVRFLREMSSEAVCSGEAGYGLALVESSVEGILSVTPER